MKLRKLDQMLEQCIEEADFAEADECDWQNDLLLTKNEKSRGKNAVGKKSPC